MALPSVEVSRGLASNSLALAEKFGSASKFVAEIKTSFERWRLAEYLELARLTEPFDPSLYDDPDEAALERHLELQRSVAELLLVERAKEWLLDE